MLHGARPFVTLHAVAVTCYERARVIASIAQHRRLSHFIAKYRAVSRLRYCEKFPLDYGFLPMGDYMPYANTPRIFLLVFMGNLAYLRPCYHALRQPVGAADRALQLL